MDEDEVVLGGGGTHIGEVVRIGDEVHRPRTAGSDLAESFLLHLERVGFDAAPRFRGVDDLGRQVLTFVAGEATARPAWLADDVANRAHLAAVCSSPPAAPDPTSPTSSEHVRIRRTRRLQRCSMRMAPMPINGSEQPASLPACVPELRTTWSRSASNAPVRPPSTSSQTRSPVAASSLIGGVVDRRCSRTAEDPG